MNRNGCMCDELKNTIADLQSQLAAKDKQIEELHDNYEQYKATAVPEIEGLKAQVEEMKEDVKALAEKKDKAGNLRTPSDLYKLIEKWELKR